MAGQLRLGQAGTLEVEVVQHGVLDAGVDQIAGERLLPDPLGHPKAADRGPQAVLQPAGVAANLADAVPRGNHRQDRLEIRPAEDLDPPLLDQLGQPVHVFGMMRGQPFHQRAAGVQRHLQRLVAAEDFQERAVAVVERLLEDVVEIADGLVVVQGQNEADAIGHGRLAVCCSQRSDQGVMDNGNNSLIGSHAPVYPVCLAEILCDSGNSASTSRRNAAACSGGTGLM